VSVDANSSPFLYTGHKLGSLKRLEASLDWMERSMPSAIQAEKLTSPQAGCDVGVFINGVVWHLQDSVRMERDRIYVFGTDGDKITVTTWHGGHSCLVPGDNNRTSQCIQLMTWLCAKSHAGFAFKPSWSVFPSCPLMPSCALQCTSYAGPCYEGGHLTAWWKIDLGEEHQVGPLDAESYLLCNARSPHVTMVVWSRRDRSMASTGLHCAWFRAPSRSHPKLDEEL
jgi:hypothetical protein